MKNRPELILELTEIHAQLRWLHQGLMDLLVKDAEVTVEYTVKSLLCIDYEKREAQILWDLANLLNLSEHRQAPPQGGVFN
jgi:hypothetical protein